MPHPEGYRKALRLMRMAERFGAPVITLIDTPGAYPGLGAEERGQSEALATSILEMAALATPCIAAVIGEGGSGGALALGVADRILMFENSVYSVISPEGCAAILWKDATQRERAAEALKLTAEDLVRLGVVDEIITEPLGGAHHDPEAAGEALREALIRHVVELRKVKPEAWCGAGPRNSVAWGRTPRPDAHHRRSPLQGHPEGFLPVARRCPAPPPPGPRHRRERSRPRPGADLRHRGHRPGQVRQCLQRVRRGRNPCPGPQGAPPGHPGGDPHGE
jgi:hypothetical protein